MRTESKHTIAIVDDDLSIRNFIARALTRAGYRTIDARNGLEAKKLIEAREAPVALVISDIRMPGGNGLDLGADLELVRPHLRILYISGLIDSIAVQSILLRNPRSILTKPFTAQELVERVQELTGSVLSDPIGELHTKGAELNTRRKGPGRELEQRCPPRRGVK